ncbi:hypothetical protein N665_0062s0100 [Sinapis alba]|nr:hypothetical protein N665_0062s0100 [Sinapis alba]
MNSSSLPLPSPPSSLSNNLKHHVFPSFHGEDVRKAFLSHILKEFRSRGIETFIDNSIERSKSIGPELIDAIRGSKIAIVLLSRNYASSTWCMNELVEIMKCREELCQTVMTIFYEVDPTDVKKQTGNFGNVFRKTCKGNSKEDIGRWRHALAEVAKIAGYHSKNWDNEADMIEDIATDVSNKLFNSTPSRDFDGLVGIGAHMKKMEQLLRPNLDDVRMIGILGPAGIGKSTIARFLYNRHSKKFQLSVFVENIKARYAIPPCSDIYGVKLRLQRQFLSEIFNHQLGIEIPHLGIVKDRLKDKKVFVVLDDVDQLEQLEAMARETCWFGPWSRIIITTQDQKLLRAGGISHIYKVGFPSSDEALEMFCMYAFGQKTPKDGFTDLAWRVASLAGKLPLGLQVMGSHFQGMTKNEWSMELPMLRTRLDGKIESILKFSYDALCDDDKYLFLHIACFFNNEEVEKVVEHLKKSFLDVRQRLRILTEKSLIFIDEGRTNMHSLLAQLGQEIVRNQSISEPGSRQFLVDEKDIQEVLTDCSTNTRCIIGINLEGWDTLHISERVLEGMSNLQFLRFRSSISYSDPNIMFSPGYLSYISPKLRLLDWELSPLTSLSVIDNPEFLIELSMRDSKLEKLWDGNKPLQNLKWMNLSDSRNLKDLSNILAIPNLKELNLSGCSSLVKLPSSIGNATNLQNLYLSGCSSLVKLPSSIGNATNLQNLYLDRCSSLIKLPSSIGNATNLQNLELDRCSSLVKLPSSIGNAPNLQNLYLSKCSSLVKLPFSIGNITTLQNLDLSGCSSLVELPSSIGNATNLRNLDLSGCSSLVEIPSSIGNATNLEKLNLKGCSSLVKLPSSIGNTTKIQNFELNGCSSLVKLPSSILNATNLQDWDFSGCSSLLELPSSLGNALNLQNLYLSDCSSLVELPFSIGNATHLQNLHLNGCSSLVNLSYSIGNATDLQNLDLSGCSNLVELPFSIGNATNLQILDLSGCSSLVRLPSSIGNATNLRDLDLRKCSSLVELPYSIGNATNLQNLYLSDCSSLVELPSSFGNLHMLRMLDLCSCSKLEVLPINVNLASLIHLDLKDCSLLKSFPEISTNIEYLSLIGTSVEEIPSSIRSWSSLVELCMSYSENLKEFSYALDSITELHLRDTNKQEIGPWVKGCSRISRLVLKDMQNLESIAELPDSLSFLDAENCVSLERLDCSFSNPVIQLNFRNCFKLNQEARNLIIQTSTRNSVILPGGEVPAYFIYRSSQSSITVKLNEKPSGTSAKFKACIVLVSESKLCGGLECRITIKQKARHACRTCAYSKVYFPKPNFSEHLYIFEVGAGNVTSTELDFVFELHPHDPINVWIKECGILPTHADKDHESFRDVESESSEYSESSDESIE